MRSPDFVRPKELNEKIWKVLVRIYLKMYFLECFKMSLNLKNNEGIIF